MVLNVCHFIWELWSCYAERKILLLWRYLPEGGQEEHACSLQFHFLINCQSSLSVRKEFSNKRIRQSSGNNWYLLNRSIYLFYSEKGEGETKHHLCCDECESFSNLSKKSERDIHNVLRWNRLFNPFIIVMEVQNVKSPRDQGDYDGQSSISLLNSW